MSTTGIASTCAFHLHHVAVEISSGYSICFAVISLQAWVHYYYYLNGLPGYLVESLAKTLKIGIHSFPACHPDQAVNC